MFNIFIMGIGMVLEVNAADKDKVIEILNKHNRKCYEIVYVSDKAGVEIK